MISYSNPKVAQISQKEAFRIMFGAYEYLRDLPENPGSGTYKVLQKIAAGDPEAITGCYLKMAEEQDEARHVIIGDHRDPELNRREQMINETEQSIYWPGLAVVGRRTDYEIVDLSRFLVMGYGGVDPIFVKKELKIDVDGRPDEKTIVAFRRSLVTAGKLLYDFNLLLGAKHGRIEPKYLADWDLKQMAERDYLKPFLVENGL